MTITLMVATVKVEPGWAVGALAVSDPAIDRDILLDAEGRPWIPGSALAGSLRAHLSRADPPADERLMGSRPPRNQAEAAASVVSPLWIVGGVFTPEARTAGPGHRPRWRSPGRPPSTGNAARPPPGRCGSAAWPPTAALSPSTCGTIPAASR